MAVDFTIQNDYITLSQLLKVCDKIDSGGQAKIYLASHVVRVNGELESRRGRKLHKGDMVELDHDRILIK